MRRLAGPVSAAMRSRLSVVALGCAVVGLGASIASAIDYLGAAPTFCAESGCDAVRESAWAHPLGVPMPLLGIAFYVAAIALSFAEAPRLRRAVAIGGAAWALWLIGLQAFQIGAWCKLCMVADPAAIGYALAVLAGARALRFSPSWLMVTAPSVFASVGLLALWTQHADEPAAPLPLAVRSDGMPAFVAEAQVRGAATVVEVVDFECPFCRRMQARLTEAIAQARHPVRVVRKMMPLDIHAHAMPAALAYCCADAQGKGAQMAEALFAADPADLTPEGCEQLARKVGCDLERYRSDMPRAAQRVASETAQAMAAGINALPTMFVGSERIVGAGKSTEQLTALLDRVAIN
jgi:protein-disulfide isomerase